MIDRARIERMFGTISGQPDFDDQSHWVTVDRITMRETLTNCLALLTIVEALAENANIPYDDEQGPFCVCCERSWPIGSVVSISDHEATCAYRQAVELLGREG